MEGQHAGSKDKTDRKRRYMIFVGAIGVLTKEMGGDRGVQRNEEERKR